LEIAINSGCGVVVVFVSNFVGIFAMQSEEITFELCDNREFYFVFSQFDFSDLGRDPLVQDELWNDFHSKVCSIVESHGFKCRRPAINRSACHAWKGYRGFATKICGILGTFDNVDETVADEILMDIHRAYDEIISSHVQHDEREEEEEESETDGDFWSPHPLNNDLDDR
jgi:hypothetical protein